MCLKCHSNLSAEYVLESLKKYLNNPQFNKWNTTSINHVVISALGNENLECRKIAIELLEKFIEYRKNKPPKPINYSKIFNDCIDYVYKKISGRKRKRTTHIQDLFANADEGFVLEPCPSIKELELILKKIKEYPAETLDNKSIHNAIYKEGLLNHIYGIPYNPDDTSLMSNDDDLDDLDDGNWNTDETSQASQDTSQASLDVLDDGASQASLDVLDDGASQASLDVLDDGASQVSKDDKTFIDISKFSNLFPMSPQ